MTNAEKFKEVFGVDPDMSVCPLYACSDMCKYNRGPQGPGCSYSWWNDEFKEVKDVN